MIYKAFRFDDMQFLAELMIYTPYGVILQSFVDALDFQGLFVFLGVKNIFISPLHLFLNLLDLNLRLY